MALKDKDIREPLFQFLEELYGRVRIIEEKNVGKARADVMLVTGEELIGVEIKSDADTYQRLASQVKEYDRVFDRNIVAVGSSHGHHIEEHVPDFWGIITIDEVDGRPDFYMLRRPKENPGRKRERQLRLLWRRELAHMQEENRLPAYREKSKLFVEKKLLECVPEERLKAQLCEELLQRDYTTIEEEIRQYRKRRRRRSAGKR